MQKNWKSLILSFVLVFALLALPVSADAALTEGWSENKNGTWSYVKDGEYVNGEALVINGTTYVFDWDSIMCEDEVISVWDDTAMTRKTYDVDANGVATEVKANDWHKHGDDWYFINENGDVVYGAWDIDGVTYYFGNYGIMAEDEIVISHVWDSETDNTVEVVYNVNENGVAKQVTGTEWLKTIDGWYYVLNGALCEHEVVAIDGTYYGFNYSNIMYEDTTFTIDDATYRAKANGALYVSEWYENSNGVWYYYGADAKALKDCVATIDGTTYIFDYNGRMETNSYAPAEDGTWYVSDEDGYTTALKNNDWTKVVDAWYYVQDGVLCTDKAVLIDGTYYAFDYNGHMFDNELTDRLPVYDEEGQDYYSANYWAQKGGALVVNNWVQDDEEWYYFGAKGEAAEGFVKVDGAEYFFLSNGRMAAEEIVVDYVPVEVAEGEEPKEPEEVYYYVDKNGAVVKTVGWYDLNGSWIYIEDATGKLLDGWKGEAGVWYYLDPVMNTSQVLATEDGEIYVADVTGATTLVTADGLYEKMFVRNGKIVKESWEPIDGSWYYFGEDGVAYTGHCTFETKDAETEEVTNTYYIFDQSGRMYADGWVYYDYGIYYAKASGELATGLQTIDGATYYFDEFNGRMYADQLDDDYVDDEDWLWYRYEYLISKDGVLEESLDNTNGWHFFDNHWYHVDDHKFCQSEIHEIDGVLYGFDWNGKMVEDGIFNAYRFNNEYMNKSGDFYADENGEVLSGWISVNDRWMYADPDTYMLVSDGVYTIDGYDYYFDGYETTVGTFKDGNMIYITDKDGWVVDTLDMTTGWTYVDGEIYYYENDKPYTGWVGNYYVRKGKMLRDGIFYIENSEGKSLPYYLDEFGLCAINQWVKVKDTNTWYLAKADGSLYQDEWYKDGSSWYYFFSDANMAKGLAYVDGEFHEFTKGGQWIGVATEYTGWQLIDGDWYYYQDGVRVYGEALIDGTWYYFGSAGKMYSNKFASSYNYDERDTYYYTTSGARANYVGWAMIEGFWYYFTEQNTIAYGWINDNGTLYYQDYYRDIKYEDGYGTEDEKYTVVGSYLVTDNVVMDGQVHLFANDGAYQGVCTTANGWYQSGDDWFYFVNGEYTTGEKTINGVTYYFNGNGVMVTDTIMNEDNGYGAYYDVNGAKYTTVGWFKLDGEWAYIDAYGRLCLGLHVIDGVVYNFDFGYYNVYHSNY